MKQKEEYRRKFIAFIVLFAVMIALPYCIAIVAEGDSHVFGGFLLNPLDGNSYFAKMREGASGAWRFTLPFTSEPGEGAYIFLFYLSLGHLCRITRIPLIWMFHIWRMLGSIFLLITLRKFFLSIFEHDKTTAWRSFFLAGIGSGFGWMIFPFGEMTSDFWVAEAYPFLSSYANPHFPIGLGVMLWIIVFALGKRSKNWQIAVLALALGLILPFGVAIDCMVIAGMVLLDYLTQRKANLVPLITVTVFGGAMIAYQVAVTIWYTVFSSWNLQNVTPAPVWWDFLLSFLPALLPAVAAILVSRKNIWQTRVVVLAVWLIGAVVLIWLPVRLQRRFILGLYIPVAGLAAYGCRVLEGKLRVSSSLLYKITLGLSIPTNVVLLLAGILGALSQNPAIYLTRAEQEAMQWLGQQSGECLVLASPQLGMYIPGHSGCKVMYGHPFETVNAAFEEEQVERFYSDDMQEGDARCYLAENGIDYVFFGNREMVLGNPEILQTLRPVFKENEVVIFSAVVK